ncbi:MAG: hypothetical protein QOE70_1699 [Chthoniobacter sp.]|jgi:hypothetical protein|nr:hypothetical protein [Chthoniobacter sp.]
MSASILACMRGAGAALAFTIAFALVSTGLNAWAPFPEVPVVRAKLAYLARHAADYDAVFIGSSRVQFQVIPALFDAAAKTRSFNLGVAGMVPPESFYFLRRVLELRLPRLKWIFIELADLDPVNLRNAGSARAAYWHDARHTLIACRDLLRSSRSTEAKLATLGEHLRLFGERTAGIGRGATLLAQRVLPPARKDPEAAWLEREGFKPAPAVPLNPKQLARIQACLAELQGGARPLVRLRPVYREGLEELIAEIRHAGAEPIFFIAPTFDWRERLTGLPGGVRLLTFDDEARFGALLDPQYFCDTVHLNERGAALFTAALAEQFSSTPR